MQHPVTWALALANRLGHSWWMGPNFAVRAAVFRQVRGFEGFHPSGLTREDIFLASKVSEVARILFDPQLVVLTSARRMREGYLSVMRRFFVNAVRTTVLRREALPVPDIR